MAVRPVYYHAFGSKAGQQGLQGETSKGYSVDGKTFIVVEVENLPQRTEPDGTTVPLGEILVEGTIGGRSWFDLCRIRQNGVFNLATLVASEAAGRTPGVLNGPSKISVYKIRFTVTKLPRESEPVRVTVLGTN